MCDETCEGYPAVRMNSEEMENIRAFKYSSSVVNMDRKFGGLLERQSKARKESFKGLPGIG